MGLRSGKTIKMRLPYLYHHQRMRLLIQILQNLRLLDLEDDEYDEHGKQAYLELLIGG